MNRYYDVIVLGRSLGALAAAALLARRDFQVLVLGQGQKPASYRFEGKTLKRRTFTLLSGYSPAWTRILHELAQSPSFRRHVAPLDPLFAVLTRERRVQLPPSLDQFSREVDREFPEVRQLVDELYATFASVNAAADTAFERDAVWPPGSFWERLETNRLSSTLPFVAGDGARDLLGKFPAGHPYRELVTLPAQFASDLAVPGDQMPPFALARLHGAWTRGVLGLADGEDELEQFLVRRIQAHGGLCRLDEKATELVVRRGAVVGVLADGEDEPFGTANVLCDQMGEMLAELSGGDGITKTARQDWPHVTATSGRFVVSLLVRTAGVPDPLPAESFLIPTAAARRDPRRPVVHLQRVDVKADPDAEKTPSCTLLVAETIMPTRGPVTLLEARDAVLTTVREHLPFIDEHLMVVDSPNDGLPLYEYVNGVRKEIDRIHLTEGTAGPEPMRWQWTVDPPGYAGLSGEPIRGPIPGTYLVGSTVLPGLGQEGELLAAWGATRVITRQDRTRQKMRRQMWSRIETS